MITAVAVSPSLDVTHVVDELRGIQRAVEVHRVGGGKALNAARAAARLDADVAAVAVLGGGTGTMVAESVRDDGVRLTVLDGAATTRMCMSVLSRRTDELTEIYEDPTPVSDEEFEALLDRVAELVAARGGWCLVSGGFPRSLPPDALARVVTVAHDAGARVAVDSHGAVLREALAARPPALVKVNRAEAAELLGCAPDADLRDVVGQLQAMTGGLVAVTNGRAGVMAHDGTAVLGAVLPEPVGSFPVGSGDAFLAGMVVALDRGDGLADALRLATATAAANALVPGAGRFDRATVDALVPAVEVTELR